MVWGLFPIDPLPGEEKYYFFNKGTYKVGRTGCDVIVNKDKGVSRIHAEIIIDEMISLDHSLKKPSNSSSKVRVRDCSKYGTFLNKDLYSKEKVHEFPNKETMLKDGDLVSFGASNATYRFSYVPFIFFICSLKHSKTNQLISKKVSSVGAGITKKWSPDCSHVLVDDSFPLIEDLVDAIISRKPLIQFSWVELIAGKSICTDIPSYISYEPSLMFEGVLVKVGDPQSRECCLRGYALLLEPEHKYKFEGRLQSLLEVGGANVSSAVMALEKNGNDRVVCVVPAGSSRSKCFPSHSSLPSVNEIDLVSAVLSGHLDPSLITSPPAPASRSSGRAPLPPPPGFGPLPRAIPNNMNWEVAVLRSQMQDHENAIQEMRNEIWHMRRVQRQQVRMITHAVEAIARHVHFDLSALPPPSS